MRQADELVQERISRSCSPEGATYSCALGWFCILFRSLQLSNQQFWYNVSDHPLQLHGTTSGSIAQLREELQKKNEELASLRTNMQQVLRESKQKEGGLAEQVAAMKKELEFKVLH